MDLRDIEATLPPGFRFYPSDEELVCYYLYKKIANEIVSKGTMVEVDLHTCEPWQLPEVAKLGANEWYFFSFRDRKYSTGLRTNRATTSGYWKATGKDRPVFDPTSHAIVGMRKTLVFYHNRAPNGIKTGWIMHEFRQENPFMPPKEDWVLCRVFHKGKGERVTKLSLANEIETTIGASPNFTSSPPFYQTLPFGSQQIDSLSQIPQHHDHSLLNSALLNNNCPQEEVSVKPFIQINSRSTEYEFLLDMDIEGNYFGDGGLPSFEEMRFEDKNGMAFI